MQKKDPSPLKSVFEIFFGRVSKVSRAIAKILVSVVLAVILGILIH